MFNSEVISKKISSKIANELELDKDNEEVIAYGLFSAIQILYNIIAIILIGAIFNVVIEALIVSFVIAILRKSSGGVHASSPIRCLIIGCIVCILIALISKIYVPVNMVVIIGIIVFSWSYYIIWRFAPVDSLSKPIKSEKKRKRLMRSSIRNLTVYIIIIIIGLITYRLINMDRILNYIMCIYGGIIWQVLTLTNIGYIIVKLIDDSLNKLTIR
ncbi:MAG: accessory gene regulator B family protein [Clostridium sp.]